MENKRGNKAQLKISFQMIFAIILIIFFIVFAFFGIKKFIANQELIVGKSFSSQIREEIGDTLSSSESSNLESFNIPKKVEQVCFEQQPSDSGNSNMYSIPRGIIEEKISGINWVKTNPSGEILCIESEIGNKISLVFQKMYGEDLVTIINAKDFVPKELQGREGNYEYPVQSGNCQVNSGEMLILDETFTLTSEISPEDHGGNGFWWWKEIPFNWPDNWLSPYDYYNGKVYTRYEIISQPTNNKGDISFVFWQKDIDNDGDKSEEVEPRITFEGPGVYTQSSSPANWWKHTSYGGIDWERMREIDRFGFATWKTSPFCLLTTWDNGCSEYQDQYFPLEIHATVVAVPHGGDFSGWDCWINGGSISSGVGKISKEELLNNLPLRISSNKRYLELQNGKPFLINGDTGWAMIVQLSKEDANYYLEKRAESGFNTIQAMLIATHHSDNPPNNYYNQPPFTGKAFTTPNEQYFEHVDYVVDLAREKGFVVFLVPFWLGWGCYESDGWCSKVKESSENDMLEYGRYLGDRYKNYDNIVWLVGGDANPPSEIKSKIEKFVQGIQEYDSEAILSYHNGRGKMAIETWPGADWLNLNNVYPTTLGLAEQAKRAYELSPSKPFFLVEGYYENSKHSMTDIKLRSQFYWIILSGGSGHIFGNCPMWHFNAEPREYFCPDEGSWRNELDSSGTHSMTHAKNFFDSINWHLLIPDFNNEVLKSGYGTLGDYNYAIAAYTSDKSMIVVYTPEQRYLTINTNILSGEEIRYRWYNPRTGAYTDYEDSEKSSSERFIPPSSGDWVLVIEVYSQPQNSGGYQIGGVSGDFDFTHYYITQNMYTKTGNGVQTAGDYDNDGDLDFTIGSGYSPTGIYWYENNGGSSWQIKTISQTIPTISLGATNYDVNKDGWEDIISAGVWYENNKDGTFTERTYDSQMQSHNEIHDLILADMNNDGVLDVVVWGAKYGSYWYDFSSNPNGIWTRYNIEPNLPSWRAQGNELHGAISPKGVGDLDGDGDNDVWGTVAWYENRNNGNSFVRHSLDYTGQLFTGQLPYGKSTRSFIIDIDNDGDNDIVFSECDDEDSRVGIIKNNGNTGSFTLELLPKTISGRRGSLHSLNVGDLNMDGHLEIITAEQEDINVGSTAWYVWTNTGNGWQEQILFDIGLGGHDSIFKDVDQDGDIDIISKVWNPKQGHNILGGAAHADYYENKVIDHPSEGIRLSSNINSGWTQRGGAYWETKGDMILGRQNNNQGGELISQQSFSDFEVVFDAWPDYSVDTGMYVRASNDGKGYQITIDYQPNNPIGGIWLAGIGDTGKWDFEVKNKYEIKESRWGDTPRYFDIDAWSYIWKENDWNQFRVRVEGNPPKITTWINGWKIYEYQDSQERLPSSGKIALQVHDGADDYPWEQGAVARFRNIKVYPF